MKEDEIAYAVANVTLFWVIGMICDRFLSHFIFTRDSVQVGLILETVIHDRVQVTGAALIYD